MAELHPDLLSAYSDAPFTSCIQCTVALGEPDTWFSIQKLIVAEEVVFEAALCGQCSCQLGEEISEDSASAGQEFMQSSPEVERRMQSFLDWLENPVDETAIAEGRPNPTYLRIREERLNHCGFCSQPRSSCHRYSLNITCSQMDVAVDAPMAFSPGGPLLTCSDCEREMNERLSKTTRDVWDRFVERNFDGPPGLHREPAKQSGSAAQPSELALLLSAR